ncbi:hypothetical protein EDD85DRAFT_796135 [Armillaria nabsnona]|nr:hypothetical protein EDD85DRAFT_796135 [Armillaria nabsnona]
MWLTGIELCDATLPVLSDSRAKAQSKKSIWEWCVDERRAQLSDASLQMKETSEKRADVSVLNVSNPPDTFNNVLAQFLSAEALILILPYLRQRAYPKACSPCGTAGVFAGEASLALTARSSSMSRIEGSRNADPWRRGFQLFILSFDSKPPCREPYTHTLDAQTAAFSPQKQASLRQALVGALIPSEALVNTKKTVTFTRNSSGDRCGWIAVGLLSEGYFHMGNEVLGAHGTCQASAAHHTCLYGFTASLPIAPLLDSCGLCGVPERSTTLETNVVQKSCCDVTLVKHTGNPALFIITEACLPGSLFVYTGTVGAINDVAFFFDLICGNPDVYTETAVFRTMMTTGLYINIFMRGIKAAHEYFPAPPRYFYVRARRFIQVRSLITCSFFFPVLNAGQPRTRTNISSGSAGNGGGNPKDPGGTGSGGQTNTIRGSATNRK